MPVYVYKNLKTGEKFEVTQSIRDDAYKVHPETGEPVKRIIQPVGIAFKGSGFYVNDSRSSSSGHAGASKGHAHSTASNDAAGGSDSKGGASETSAPVAAKAPASAPTKSASSAAD